MPEQTRPLTDSSTELYLVRHGETEWSKSGQHTSITDLELTEDGIKEAELLRDRLNPDDFGLVLSSPRQRAVRTAELAGFDSDRIETTEDLAEWYYGDYEGRTSADIRKEVPDWRIWTHPMPNGETADQVMERLTRVVTRVRESGVDRAIAFAHGHSLRVLALAWLSFPVARGESFPLRTATISILGREKESPAIRQWNA